MILAIPYYESPKMLEKHIEYWNKYSPKLLKSVDLVMVDDGSKKHPLKREGFPEFRSLTLARIKKDVAWNYVAARNLCFYLAPDGWVLSTDMDHVVPAESMVRIVDKEPYFKQENYYRPERYYYEKMFQPYRRHNSTYIIHKRKYWHIGGYDETFAGYYGGGSSAFRYVLNKTLNCVELDGIYTIHFQDYADSSAKLGREESDLYYKKHHKMMSRHRQMRRDYNPKILKFDYELR